MKFIYFMYVYFGEKGVLSLYSQPRMIMLKILILSVKWKSSDAAVT